MTRAIAFATIVYHLLHDPRGWRVEDLREFFGIAPRTWRTWRRELQRIAALQGDDGEPLIQQVGAGEGARVVLRGVPEAGPSDELYLPWVAVLGLTRQVFGRFQGTPLADASEDFVARMAAGLRMPCGDHGALAALDALERKLYVHAGPTRDYDGHREHLEALLRATIYSRRVHATYHAASRGGEVREEVLEPLSLVTHDGALYVMARRQGSTRVKLWELGRFSRVHVTREGFEYPPPCKFDPASYFEGHFGVFTGELTHSVLVELAFAPIPWLEAHIRERTWHPTQRLDRTQDDRLRLSFETHSMERVWPWIRSFGDDVEVLRPEGPIPRSHAEQVQWRQTHTINAA